MTVRLLGYLLDNWEMVDGYAVAHGVPELEDLPLGRLANFVYFFLVKDAEPDQVERVRNHLWMPPVGVKVTDARSPWSAESETAALAGLQAAVG